ncbi:Ail/Lom family outer membrane beta-barrel protein [Tatumella citrea]|uniref:Virulence protein n=1 Tax=Tatumella citrea TaxID=53336 RepID=A0A1Y0LA85_TATCI|nr:Ail/Lom family outer membrane beta-barrel protein [Tatumella citrea]ARU94966.1 virulence protein [Tatumella citrea]ARU99004.1 virulence protein [Tatumella citrea]
MKAKIMMAALLCGGLFANTSVLADSHTVSVGYAQSKVADFKNIRGINVQYRYEWDSPVSVIGSFSYMKGDNDYSYRVDFNGDPSGYDGHDTLKYYSLLTGPAYRINDYVSIYALIGAVQAKAEGKTTYLTQYSEKFSSSATSFAYGAGVIVNPTENFSVNFGYEGTRVKFEKSFAINGFNLGVGYRF